MQPKELARAYYDAGNRDDLDAWDAFCDPAMTLYPGFTDPVQGLAAIKHFTAEFHSAFSGLYLTVHDLVADGDLVAARWTAGGVHARPMPTPAGMVPATGRSMAMDGISIVRVSHGRIVEERVQADILGAMQQLGVVPKPGSGPGT